MRPRPVLPTNAATATRPAQVGCLHFRDFFFAVERARNPSIAGRAMAIGRKVGLAIVSREARACGVVPGMSGADLAARCPGAVVLAGRVEPYLETVALADEALWRIGISADWHGFSECLFEPTSPQNGPSSLRRLAEAAMTGVSSSAGLDVSCGLADTVVAARAAARLAEPRGLLQVLPGYDARFLAPLALRYLDGVDEAVAARLSSYGVSQIGRLATCSTEELRDALGRAAGPLVELARGRDPRRVGGRRVPSQLVRTAALDPSAHSHSSLRDVAGALAEDLEHALAAGGLRAGAVTLRRYGVDAVVHGTAPVGGDVSSGPVGAAVQSVLATPAAFPVVRVTVAVSKLTPAGQAERRWQSAEPAGRRVQGAGRRSAG